MKILDVKLKKNSAIITCDNNIAYSVAIATILTHNLSVGTFVEDGKFLRIAREGEVQLCKDYLFGYLSSYAKSRRQAYAKLAERGFCVPAILAALAAAEEYGLLDDRRLAENYIQTHGESKGTLFLRQKLRQMGIDDQIVADCLLQSPPDGASAALCVAQKYMRNKNPNDPKTRQSLFRHLAARGFSYDDIKGAASAVCTAQDDDAQDF